MGSEENCNHESSRITLDQDFITTCGITYTMEQAEEKSKRSTSGDSAFNSIGAEATDELFHGQRLNLKWLLSNNQCLRANAAKDEKGKMRQWVHCSVCREFETEASKFSKTGVVPMASDVRVEGKEKLKRLVLHIESVPHKQALATKKSSEMWSSQSANHPWVAMLRKHDAAVVNLLIRLAVDVYNDSLMATLPAWNWPSRSLAQMKADQVVASLADNGWDSNLEPFMPPNSSLHYRDPVTYRDMLEVVASLELDKLTKKLDDSICCAIQIDGSVDRQQADNKFVCVRSIDSSGCMQSAFLAAVEPERNGAKGLLEAAISAISRAKIDCKKIAGITTDGESANTGKHGGLWKLLQDHLQKSLITVWCACHRSDLAMEDMENAVPELTLWRSNIVGLATYFRTSKCRTKALAAVEHCNVVAFPSHHEVRFAEHLHNLIKAVLNNLEACRTVFKETVENPEASRDEKAKSQGFLKLWSHGSTQVKITALMYDICDIFKRLQQGLQKDLLIIPDVLTLRDSACRKLDVVLAGPMPGGKEQELAANEQVENNASSYQQPRLAARNHQFVTSNVRSYSAVRLEVVNSAKNFIAQRLNIELDGTVSLITAVINAKTCTEFVAASVEALKLVTSKADLSEKQNQLVNECCDCWSSIAEIPVPNDADDAGAKLSLKLRKMYQKASGVLKFLLGSFLVVSPHSMGTERVVSHHNKLKSIQRSSLTNETVNDRLIISVNGVGTARYNPRPAVAAFLKKKDRRYREPQGEIYQNRDFINKFFRADSAV